VTREDPESTDAPYFIDLVDETLQSRFQHRDYQSFSFRICTTLTMNLQREGPGQAAWRTGQIAALAARANVFGPPARRE
jgi:penicillin-binding protein 1B